MTIKYLLIATLLSFLIFLIIYKRNKFRLLNGVMFGIFLMMSGISYCFFVLQYENYILRITAAIPIVFILCVLVFGLYVVIIFLFINSYIIFKKERFSLSNSLTLILGISFTLYLLTSFFVTLNVQSPFIQIIWWIITLLLSLYLFHIVIFFTSLILANLARPKYNQDYIIVLGSGLINGNVPPLLARRIDKAICFYQKQSKRKRKKIPMLLMSGGQGNDESRSEAEAMAEYAINKGIPKEQIMLESKATNTYENMLYSKQMMDQHAKDPSYHCIYSTNNYHLFRAGIYAQKVGLFIDGIGCKTALYYLPNALLREYIALIVMYRKTLLKVTLFLIVVIVLSVVFIQITFH